MDLRLRYQGGGRFQTAFKLDFDLVESGFKAGDTVRAKVERPRSVRQNDFFHALIEAAFDNQRGGPKLPTWRHLKAYLLVQAGHCDEARVKVPARATQDEAIAMAAAVAAALRRRFDTVWVTLSQRSREIVMRFAKSVAFGEIGGEGMAEIVDKVVAIICAEIVPGSTPEEIFAEAQRRTGSSFGSKRKKGKPHDASRAP